MFYHDGKLQYPVEVEKPNALYAKMLQQAIGGIEGEMRVALQYLFQAWNSRGPKRYREMLLETGTEELAHIEILVTAVAKNLEGADAAIKVEVARDNPAVAAMLGGMEPRHFLSSGLGGMPTNADGVPFTAAYVVATGNLAADMYANLEAETAGRLLATRLYEMTDDPGMKDMWSFLIARDTMHQNQWLAVLEELGFPQLHPIPNSFPQAQENQEFNYVFLSTHKDGPPHPEGRWSTGRSIDTKGTFSIRKAEPRGPEPQLAPPVAPAHAQNEQNPVLPSQSGNDEGIVDKLRDTLTGS